MVYKSRWAPDEKIRIVLESMNTNITVAELCRKHGVRPPSFYAWREKFFQGGRLALSGQLRDPVKETEAENERLKKLIGELTIANECFKKHLRPQGGEARGDGGHARGGASLRSALECPQYTSGAFRESMQVFSLRLEHIMYRTPEQNGSIESFHRTLKKEYIWPYEFESFQDAERAIKAAFVDYNQNRIHSSLGYLTPSEFLELWYAGDDSDEQKEKLLNAA